MEDSQNKTLKKLHTSKKYLSERKNRFDFNRWTLKDDESLKKVEVITAFSTKENNLRIEKFSFDKVFLSRRTDNSAKLALNIFKLLSGNKTPNAKSLIVHLIKNKLLSPNELKSFIPKNKGGRKRKYLDQKTGKIFNMKEPNKTICELFNEGKEPEAIRDEVFKQFRSENGKMKKLFLVRRILRENNNFLTRPFN